MSDTEQLFNELMDEGILEPQLAKKKKKVPPIVTTIRLDPKFNVEVNVYCAQRSMKKNTLVLLALREYMNKYK
jgi:hypothetical protein